MVFENHWKSLILHNCERSELRLHFELVGYRVARIIQYYQTGPKLLENAIIKKFK